MKAINTPIRNGKRIGITGTRDLDPRHAHKVTHLISLCQKRGDLIITGCAKGVDEMAIWQAQEAPKLLTIWSAFQDIDSCGNATGVHKAQAKNAQVAYGGVIIPEGSKKRVTVSQHLAHRSQQVVKNSDVVVGFVDQHCPAKLDARKTWQSGTGSGTWQTLAYAAGQGRTVVVFSVNGIELNEETLPNWPRGQWEPAADSGFFAEAWIWWHYEQEDLGI
jgi:hypothetical protein